MKINANCKIDSNGSWLLDRNGNIVEVNLHVPSTTWSTRGLSYLAPTDAEFLLNQQLITENEARCILMYNLYEYLKLSNKSECSIIDITMFSKYAELSYAPKVRSMLMSSVSRKSINEIESECIDFEDINNIWYRFLQNNYVKVSRFGKQLEFRIQSDNIDWNKPIIDEVLLKNDVKNLKISILKELPDAKCKVYFSNASLDDILEYDKTVLASRKVVSRKIVNSEIVYY